MVDIFQITRLFT